MPKAIKPIRIEGNIAYVPLTKGYEAIIDVSDVTLVEGWNWHAMPRPNTVYAKRTSRVDGKQVNVLMHRVIMGATDGEVDHRDRDGLNNRRGNLRMATHAKNSLNRKGVLSVSGLKGVSWHNRDKVWRARITKDGREKNLGYFDTPEAAHAAYCKASAELHGEFGRTA